MQTSRGKVLLVPYFALLGLSFFGSMYMMGRTVLVRKPAHIVPFKLDPSY